MTTKTLCKCGHEISQHSYSENFTGCDIEKCDCDLDMGLFVDEQAATIARLTAANESMQEDAVQNTFALNAFKASDKLATEQITALKQELDQIKSCKHMNVKIHSRLWRASTLEEPAEYEYKAECKDCGELFSADDVDEWAEVEE